jgi:hypothetical protein
MKSIFFIVVIAIIALAFLFTFGWGLNLFIVAVVDKLNSVQSDLSKTLITASATVLAAVVVLVFGKIWEQRNKIRDEIRAKKIPIYENHIETLFKIFLSEKLTGKKPDQNEIAKSFALFSEKMIIWGSGKVIKEWGVFRTLKYDEKNLQKNIHMLEDLFLAIRKDVGSDTLMLSRGDLLRLFVNEG